ncbi:uncharacterized protein LOC119603729 [Lucilia sericata]|uniref:uncharacterized protein LOC119603729 n=1 Tax=Lucilia sericata TaxID=13632 RepID=UPI0018A7F724|nr:uncharacterized protein LOC119603729 [Lucilia sericata]
MLALYSDISDHLQLLILTTTADNQQTPSNHDFIIMDDINAISNALNHTTATHLTNEEHDEHEHCTRLDSCQSPDQFFISMVNEFLNDDTTTLPDETAKTSPLAIEYLEEPNETVVESLINFHCLTKNSEINNSSNSSTSSSTSTTAITPVSTISSATGFRINKLTDDTRNMNSLLLSNLNDNLPDNVKEISYQRFGRFNTNLPAEVHNFKCHLCAFSCALKEVLLQHFQDKHPT